MASRAAVLTSNASCAAVFQSTGRSEDTFCKRVALPISARASKHSRLEVQSALEKSGWKLAPMERLPISRMAEPVDHSVTQAQVGIAPETLQALEAVTTSLDKSGKVS